jgi:type III pantothenate kinase
MQLVVDCGSKEIKAGLFEEDRFLESFIAARPEQLLEFLKDKKIGSGLISGGGPEIAALLTGFPCKTLEPANFKRLGTEQPDKIANIFGALYRFPLNDCVIVDLGTVVRFDYVTKQGVYLGGAVFPNFEAIFHELEKQAFPGFGEQSIAALGKQKIEQSKSGCYFGLLGAIERVVAELRLSSEAPSNVMAVATGGPTRFPQIQKDLQDFIDYVDPHLTLIGLNQILKEGNL